MWWLAGTAVAAGALAVVVVVTRQGAADAERLEREGEPVVAEVLARESENALEVAYDLPEGDGQQSGLAPVDSARDWKVGDRFPAVVDPADPGHVRLLASPYDAAEPVVWATLPLLAVLVGLARSLSRDRTVRRLAAGPWRGVEVRTAAHDRPQLALPGARSASCSVLRLPHLPPSGTIHVAGALIPGRTLALRLDQTVVGAHAWPPAPDPVETAIAPSVGSHAQTPPPPSSPVESSTIHPSGHDLPASWPPCPMRS